MEKTVVQTNNKYAIVINTYDRPFSLLNQTVKFYRQNWGSMSYDRFLWNNHHLDYHHQQLENVEWGVLKMY